MRSFWNALYAEFDRHLNLHTSHKTFRRWAGEHSPLAGFDDPAALAAYLNDPGQDRAGKERALRVLVDLHRQDDDKLAEALLWRGLWPGLDAIHRRLLRFFAGRQDELAGEIAARFTTELRRIDPARCANLPATLLMNVERDIRRQEMRRRQEQANAMPIDLMSDLPAPPDGATELRRLALNVIALVGREQGELLIAELVIGLSHDDLARLLGISNAASRKRCQRARAALREKIDTVMSRSDALDGLFIVNPASNQGGR